MTTVANPKPKPKSQIAWAELDWTKSIAQLAKETGRSPQYVRHHRLLLFPPDTFERPPSHELEANVTATSKKFAVPWPVAKNWHVEADKPGKRGPRPLVLPPDFTPTTLQEDAKRLGVAVYTLWKAMRRQGIAPGRGRAKGSVRNAGFSIPPDFVPTSFREDAKRLGVASTTFWHAMRQKGVFYYRQPGLNTDRT